ncbi:hypothetical protein BOA8489_01726 [Boseongicola aestuarii]|uniref:Uncharacterized protein n=1 Tax=Boseongicola aestuarii TaxID=1470561 RepID=A0A238IYY7_9RHOB|nr:hypothetical protein BOA8489_01726 [Boseongicola aestuarii]
MVGEFTVPVKVWVLGHNDQLFAQVTNNPEKVLTRRQVIEVEGPLFRRRNRQEIVQVNLFIRIARISMKDRAVSDLVEVNRSIGGIVDQKDRENDRPIRCHAKHHLIPKAAVRGGLILEQVNDLPVNGGQTRRVACSRIGDANLKRIQRRR